MISIRSMQLRTKFLSGLVGIVLILGVTMAVFVRITVHRNLYGVLERRAVSLARSYAEHSIDLVLTERFLDLRLMLTDQLRAEPDLVYLFVLDSRGQVKAHTFSEGFPMELRTAHPLERGNAYNVLHFETEKGHIIDVVAPLLDGSAGSLHLGLAGESVEQGVRDIIRQIILIIAGVLLAGGIAIAIFTRTVTKPLLALEDTVEAMGRGDLSRRVTVMSDDEIGRLGEAFNAMADRRSRAEDDREKLIEDLRVALDNVKTLRGLIPICASCKRIRDDSGYWGQIEAYIARHSDAEFSHGICPECAEKLYPGKRVKKPERKT